MRGGLQRCAQLPVMRADEGRRGERHGPRPVGTTWSRRSSELWVGCTSVAVSFAKPGSADSAPGSASARLDGRLVPTGCSL